MVEEVSCSRCWYLWTVETTPLVHQTWNGPKRQAWLTQSNNWSHKKRIQNWRSNTDRLWKLMNLLNWRRTGQWSSFTFFLRVRVLSSTSTVFLFFFFFFFPQSVTQLKCVLLSMLLFLIAPPVSLYPPSPINRSPRSPFCFLFHSLRLPQSSLGHNVINIIALLNVNWPVWFTLLCQSQVLPLRTHLSAIIYRHSEHPACHYCQTGHREEENNQLINEQVTFQAKILSRHNYDESLKSVHILIKVWRNRTCLSNTITCLSVSQSK